MPNQNQAAWNAMMGTQYKKGGQVAKGLKLSEKEIQNIEP